MYVYVYVFVCLYIVAFYPLAAGLPLPNSWRATYAAQGDINVNMYQCMYVYVYACVYMYRYV